LKISNIKYQIEDCGMKLETGNLIGEIVKVKAEGTGCWGLVSYVSFLQSLFEMRDKRTEC